MTEEKVWLITGAGRGLGVDIAKAALVTKLDVTRPQDAQAAVETAVAKFGRIDILLGNRLASCDRSTNSARALRNGLPIPYE
jgi:NAD(P)-dependent dehydrogenase (short-subunit alcohol dehydrogenase family)